MHAYCLFCETQKCAAIALQIERVYGVRCIYPQIVQRKWVRGECREQRHNWLQGYLFLYSEEPIFPKYDIGGILRWLGRDELKGQDLDFARTLYEQNGVMGTIRLVEEGDRCRVADPLWQNLSGEVVRIDRGRKRCCVKFDFDGISRNVWVGYDLVSPTDEDNIRSFRQQAEQSAAAE